jgi:hypothetical protein
VPHVEPHGKTIRAGGNVAALIWVALSAADSGNCKSILHHPTVARGVLPRRRLAMKRQFPWVLFEPASAGLLASGPGLSRGEAASYTS